VTNLGIFVCSRCAGLHRELNHKVKGIIASVFNDKETEFLRKWGNENARKVWLHSFKKSKYGEPNSKDSQKLKEFMKTVYEQKRFYKKEESSSEEESESESEEEKEREPKHKTTPNNKPVSTVYSNVILLETNNRISSSPRSKEGEGEGEGEKDNLDNRYR